MSGTVIALQHPIEVGGETVREITMQRPRVKHLRAMDKVQGDIARSAMLVAELADLPPSSVEQMDGADFNACMECLVGFFGGVPPIGGT